MSLKMLRRKPSRWRSFSRVAVGVGVGNAASEVAVDTEAVGGVVSTSAAGESLKLEGSQGFPRLS
jgi:hypothetical protein